MSKNTFHLSFYQVTPTAITINWEEKISHDILVDILKFKQILKKHIDFIDMSHGFSSILIQFANPILNFDERTREIEFLYEKTERLRFRLKPQNWKIPVCYQMPYAIDLKDMAQQLNLSPEKIIQYHSKVKYTVYFIGFLPGFFYLGGLNPILYSPRRKNPRKRVGAGSVGIGGSQTGIYSVNSPGGWNIIGYTPYRLFDQSYNETKLPQPGDTIEFFPIDQQELKNYSHD